MDSGPTFFEVAAADSLTPSLKAALAYSLSVFAQRHTGLHRLLAHEDELFALLTAVVEYQSLASGDASLAESLYGLHRTSMDGKQLSQPQRLLSLLVLVGLPYLRAKAESAYLARNGGDAARLGLVDTDEVDAPQLPGRQAVGSTTQMSRLSAHLPSARIERLLVTAFPYLHWASEMSSFVMGLSYVFGASRSHSLMLSLLRLRMVRTGQDHVTAFTTRTSARRAAAVRMARSRHLGAARALLLRTWFAAVDGTRPALLAAVLGFKLAEWWFGTAEAALQQEARLPVPPPPPRLPLAPNGLPLPPDTRQCPVCLRQRVNPAVAAPSGIVFCYPCIRDAVDRAGRCPVTGVKVQASQIRRLYVQ